MSLCILGTSHAPTTFKEACRIKGVELTDDATKASLLWLAQDSPTHENGARDQSGINEYVIWAAAMNDCPIILSSQVVPGTCRGFGMSRLYHMAETLRIKDALERALRPEQFVIGCMNPEEPLPEVMKELLSVFGCPVWTMTYEAAEFSKIAINATLASQVENTNRLAQIAGKLGIDRHTVSRVLKHDRRIGRWNYLEPGHWEDSSHIMRDMHWLLNQ